MVKCDTEQRGLRHITLVRYDVMLSSVKGGAALTTRFVVVSTLDVLMATLRLGDHLVAIGSPRNTCKSDASVCMYACFQHCNVVSLTCEIYDSICASDSFLQLLSVVELQPCVLQLVARFVDIPGQHSHCVSL